MRSVLFGAFVSAHDVHRSPLVHSHDQLLSQYCSTGYEDHFSCEDFMPRGFLASPWQRVTWCHFRTLLYCFDCLRIAVSQKYNKGSVADRRKLHPSCLKERQDWTFKTHEGNALIIAPANFVWCGPDLACWVLTVHVFIRRHRKLLLYVRLFVCLSVIASVRACVCQVMKKLGKSTQLNEK